MGVPDSIDGEAIARRVSRGTRRATARVVSEGEVPFGPRLSVGRFRFGNGLRVRLLRDTSAPVLAYQTWLGVGSRHEKPGKTGLAHLLEHLMFNETKALGAGELDRLFEEVGADTNAGTWVDWTYYYENLPKGHLGLAVRLEADRLRNLVLRVPQVRSEKDVVLNERQMSVDDDVEGKADELLYALAFRRHPYRWPTIGFAADIAGLTPADVRAFYRTHYAPNNATLVVAGDFEFEEALSLVQEHYGAMKPSRLPDPPSVKEPAQRAERRAELAYATPTPKVAIGYRAPAFASPDWAAMQMTRQILFGGRSSRCYRALVLDSELCAQMRASLTPFQDPGLVQVWLSTREGVDPERAIALLEDELARLRDAPVREEELEKVKNGRELSLLSALETAEGKAHDVGFYETVLGDPSRAFGRLDEYRAVTAEDVQRVARRYLDPKQRCVVRVRPTEGAA